MFPLSSFIQKQRGKWKEFLLMRVIGTAGHVDHGKSTLIQALTGTHPDRLKEEQAREMTIELGFAWLTLPNGEEVGIVDVPGHRDFIENMLAGIGGIDAALLIIAADEGIMPQTKEHIAILDLLGISPALIVLTKTDLASDSGWLELLELDIRQTLSNTTLKDSPIIKVSAKNKTGLDALITNLQSLLENKPIRPNLNRPRLPIDRVFSMSGFGTVITGTLSDGELNVGDEIEILPNNLKGRIRGLQTHKKKEETATPGSRTAVNISGIETESIKRGDVLVHPNQYQATRRIDAKLNLLKDISNPIKHGDEVKFFVGASEGIATIRLLGTEELKAGEIGWIQLELREPILAVRGDRYILRRPSPSETLGGGIIVDHQPKGRHKRFDDTVLKSLESLSHGSPAEVLLEAASALGIASIKEVKSKSRLDSEQFETALDELIANQHLILLEENKNPESLVVSFSEWQKTKEKILGLVSDYHKQYRLRSGMPKEELKNKIKLSTKQFNIVLEFLITNHELRFTNVVSKPEHEILFTQQEQAAVKNLMRKFEENPYTTPSVKECQSEVGEEVLNALIESDGLISVSQDVIFRKKDYDDMLEKIKSHIKQSGQITLAEVRDIFSTTRKYAQALLEYLDAINITVRAGDARKLK
ncbi:MAG TPA: selenocysteine-specific translation elongation factor [Anaerolineae bacterium]|nr:selenocysteine-specific translation elongation factor [Anaerolineae bacterium]